MRLPRANPPFFFLTTIILMVLLNWLGPVHQLFPVPWNLIGLAPLAGGLYLSVWTDRLFKQAGTTVKPYESPERLMLGGPFRISRHPMYLGMIAAILGVAILLGSLGALLMILPFALIMDRFVAMEERNLLDTFGRHYQDYRRRVRRWL